MTYPAILNEATITAVNGGHCGIFTITDIAYFLGLDDRKRVRNILSNVAKNGGSKSICKGLYINPLSRPNPASAIYKIALMLRPRAFNYISLESELSHIGVISQIPMDRLTVMTTGRSGEFKTDYGVVEFTHTKRAASELTDDVYFDDIVGMFRAKKSRAISDLKRVGRNVDMMEPYDD